MSSFVEVQPTSAIITPSMASLLQRACACGAHSGGGECASCREKRERSLQRAAVSSGPATAPPIVQDVLRSPGQPLDAATRAFMEPRFGHDFSRVRVHTGAHAAESARAVSALAYTVGSDVVFGAGQYAPATTAGRRLMAHELTHVVQQSAGPVAVQTKLPIGAHDDASEREADRVAEALTTSSGPLTSGIHTTAPALRRKCGAEIGAPLPDCQPAEPTFVSGEVFKFDVNCDTLKSSEAAHLALFTAGLASGSAVTIHGYASLDGDELFNMNLSCHRANQMADRLRAAPTAPTITAIFKHGETPGPADERRSVVVQVSAPQPVPPTPPPTPPETPTPVFICSKDLGRSPIGKHAFFRIGGSGPSNHTMELEPEEIRPGCWQGVPQRDFPDDFSAPSATCVATSITVACLESEFASYPIGRYCTLGPNSNTFVGHIARACGATGVRPPGFLPGFDDAPPTSRTFAPSPESTLVFGCSTIDCPQPSDPRIQQSECVKDLGLCSIPGGLPTDEDIHRWNIECRGRTGYTGDDITRDECP